MPPPQISSITSTTTMAPHWCRCVPFLCKRCRNAQAAATTCAYDLVSPAIFPCHYPKESDELGRRDLDLDQKWEKGE
jgi:hypothetical protein